MSDKEIKQEEIVPFKVLSEDFTLFELEDGSLLKSRNLLHFVIKTSIENEQGQSMSYFNTQLINAIFSPVEIRGEPGKIYSVPELEENIIQENLMFKILDDNTTSIYETENSTIMMRLIIKRIDKTSKYDPRAQPQYIVRSETELAVIDKDEQVTEQILAGISKIKEKIFKKTV